MDCPKCHKKNMGKDHKCNAPKVIQIEQCPEVVTFHTVEVPASVPEEDLPPTNGKHHNTVVRYLSSGNVYLYSSDGIPVRLTPEESRDFNRFTNASLGTIKGSTNAGQVFAENDGTGSLNGWDSLSARVADLENKEMPMTFQWVGLGFDMSAVIYRYGNLVIVINPSTVGANLSSSTAGQEIPLTEAIPEGFRPVNEGTINSTYQDADADSTQFHSGVSWAVHADGSMGLRYKTSVSSPHSVRVAVLGVWVTGDDWPSEDASA